MFNRILLYLKNFDWILFFAALLLICFGLAEIYSVALSKDQFDLINFRKQIFFVVLGMVALFSLAFFDYYNLKSFSNYLYILGVVVLVAVLFLGTEAKGTKGWFDVGIFRIQPVEFVKILLIIFLARYFSNNSIKVNPLKHLIVSGLGAAIFAGLVILQPDFGSALLLLFIWGAIVVLSGFEKKYIFSILMRLFVIFASGWLFFFQDYQKNRILTFIRPSADNLSADWNITQSIIAVGSGGLMGRGIGFGTQSQHKFLPEAQTDFIFAVIAEELGFLGVALVLFFFAIIFYRMLRALREINNDFGIYLVLGVLVLLFIEMFINIGMNMGILPVVGISLPFVSYGGSSILSSLMLIGIVESVIIRSKINY
ncbi:MAG: rod shape-determining protein RodA [Candidatus Magasanikbacteria bacterium]|nr:rod shape-determining protein RodA [Candidatus Magasanikbacteria bacterium]